MKITFHSKSPSVKITATQNHRHTKSPRTKSMVFLGCGSREAERVKSGGQECPLHRSVGVFPFGLQSGEEVGAAVGAEEFVVFYHGRGANASGRKRMFDADDAGGETDADRVGEGDVGRERQSDFKFGAGLDGAVEVEENAAGTDILSLGVDFGDAFEADDGGEAHVKAPHHPPFL